MSKELNEAIAWAQYEAERYGGVDWCGEDMRRTANKFRLLADAARKWTEIKVEADGKAADRGREIVDLLDQILHELQAIRSNTR